MMKALPALTAAVLAIGLSATHIAIAQEQPVQFTQNGSGTPLYINPSTIRNVQKELNKQGFSTGVVDGIWGVDTAAAIKSFQIENDLDPTGKPDIATLTKLNIDLGLGAAQPAVQEQTADQAAQTEPAADEVAEVEPAAGEASESDSENEASEKPKSSNTIKRKAYPQ